MSKRVLVWCTAVLAALLVAVIVLAVILLGALNKQSADDAYRACMARANANSTTVDEVARAAASCSR